ncbi:MAG: glycosyltransferase family 2 protein [Paracoccaceae bacterium]
MRITLVSTLKNEGPYLLEWLAYHRSVGVTDFVLFSNDCTDGSNLMLNRLDAMGVVRHYDNPLGPRMDPQRAAYSRAGRMADVRASDWVVIVDGDEFVNVHAGDRTIPALIEACGAPDAISLNWRLMGSGGAGPMTEGVGPGQLVTERFTRGSSFTAPENGLVRGFKTLFRPDRFGYFGVHRPKWNERDRPERDAVDWRNGSGGPMGERIVHKGWRSSDAEFGAEFGQVNHYAVKARADFLLKRLRGTANSKNRDRIDMGYWGKYDLNGTADASIPTAGIRPLIEDWLSDPDLAALHRACLDCARRVLAHQLEHPDYARFVETGHLPDGDAKDAA